MTYDFEILEYANSLMCSDECPCLENEYVLNDYMADDDSEEYFNKFGRTINDKRGFREIIAYTENTDLLNNGYSLPYD